VRHKPMGLESLGPHIHWAYRVISIISSFSLGAIIALGLYYSPYTIGRDFLYIFVGLMVFSLTFIYLSKKAKIRDFVT